MRLPILQPGRRMTEKHQRNGTTMPDTNAVPPLSDVLGSWHDFYMLLGTASATLIGLLFVAATIGSGVFSSGRRAASRVFLSASVIHFSTILIACLIVVSPIRDWRVLAIMIAGCGVFGLGYYGVTWRDTVRDGLNKSIDLEDRFWYAVLPVIGYLCETGSGFALQERPHLGCTALALSMGLLLVVGIHNAWDITLWTITRTRE
jgi:hypothetical protein